MSTVTEAISSSPAFTTLGSGLPLTPAQISEKIELLRAKFSDPSYKLTKEIVLVASSDLQTLYRSLLMSDLEIGIQRQLDNFMWTDCFKTPLTFFMKTDRTLFHWMIEAGVGFYLGFIQDIGIHFDVQFIKNSARNLFCTIPKSKQTWKCPPKSVVYFIIQNSMIHIGDLLRYRGSFLEALRMYEKSTSVCPCNGHPYNQMGLVQLHLDSKSIDSLLSGIYYYVRAVSVSNPFLAAQDNLINLLGKVKSVDPRTQEEEFVHTFLLGIGQLDSTAIPTTSFTSYLTAVVIKKSLTFHHVFRLLVISLWAWHREAEKRRVHGRIEAGREENNALEINVAMLNGLVGGLMEYHDLSTARYLPHLKICVDWLRLHPDVLQSEIFLSTLNVANLCRLLNRLVPTENSYTEVAKDLAHVILPEEKKLLGYLPLTKAYEHLQSPFDEFDPRLYSLRTGRLLQGMDVLADAKPQFIERNVLTKEYKQLPRLTTTGSSNSSRSALPAPSRRNVALQSIFNQIVSPTAPARTHSTTLPGVPYTESSHSPVTTPVAETKEIVKSTIGDGRRSRQSPPSYYFQGQSNPPTPNPELFTSPLEQNRSGSMRAPPILGEDDPQISNDFTSLFTSIWTPFQEKSAGGWN